MSELLGKLYPKKSLSGTNASVKEWIWLIGLGGAIVLFQSFLRIPLHLPGHHGLEWMAILMISRLTSNVRWASSVSSTTAAGLSMIPALGVHDPFMPLIYLLPGLVIDLVYSLLNRTHLGVVSVLILSALAGIAHSTKPVFRVVINSFMHFPYGSLLSGFVYPTVTHFLFGFMGGSFGIMLVLLATRKSRQQNRNEL